MTFVPEEERERVVVSRHVPIEGSGRRACQQRAEAGQLEGRAAGDDVGDRQRQRGRIGL